MLKYTVYFKYISIHIHTYKKNYYSLHKNIKQLKMFPDHQICILEWFLKDHVTLKCGVMTAKYSAFYSVTGINDKILSYFKLEKCFRILIFLLKFQSM